MPHRPQGEVDLKDDAWEFANLLTEVPGLGVTFDLGKRSPLCQERRLKTGR